MQGHGLLSCMHSSCWSHSRVCVCVCVHLCTAVRRLTLCNVFLESLCVEVEGPGLLHSRTAASSDCFLEASLVTWSEAEKRVYERFISS